MEEALAIMFIFENIAFVGIGFVVLMVRMLRDRKEKRREEEQNRALDTGAQQQIADMRDEMTQMREMMADFLLDMHASRAAPVERDKLGKVADVE